MIKQYSVADAQKTILQRTATPTSLPPALQAGIRRLFGADLTPAAVVQQLLADIRERGDTALRYWTQRIDGPDLPDPQLPPALWAEALARLDPDLVASMQLAAQRIRAFHACQPLPSWTTSSLGGILGQKMTPLDRVGIYVPGGSAPLPSSLLMTAIPAKVAGVPQLVVATPPDRQGQVPDIILAAAHIAGVDALYRIGGAQAMAALAFGTETIPRVDKIAGAGNLFVTLAKQQLFGQVGLDGLFGPTETVVVADDTANPAWVAADLLAQAEHDPLATAILFTPSQRLATAVQIEVGRQLEARQRADVIAAALQNQGGIVLTADVAQAVQLADTFAPEHLCLAVEDLAYWQEQITHAGGLFLGERSFEVLGDYVAGPSHIMPTGGTARFASPLNALDFVRLTSIIQLDDETATRLSPVAARLARAESLDAHAQAAQLRVGGDASSPPVPAPSFERLVRPTVRHLTPYTPILPPEILAQEKAIPLPRLIKLDANENPYGPSPQVAAALAAHGAGHIYPDPESRYLRHALARFTTVPAELLLAGAGADELIDLVLRALLDPGDIVINCPPSFGMYPFSTAVNAGQMCSIPRRPDFSLDVAAIEAAVRATATAKVLFLCSPNNPDGSLIPDEILTRLLQLPLLVVLDEAYIEFAATDSRIKWVEKYANLVVLRTFSKWAGLAGFRIGYGAFPAWLIAQLWKIKQPYNVSTPAATAALASLADQAYLWSGVERLQRERERLYGILRGIPYLTAYPSQANFVLCKVGGGRTAAALQMELADEGIFVRYFDNPHLRNFIRISVGLPADTDSVAQKLMALSDSPPSVSATANGDSVQKVIGFGSKL